VGLWWGKIHLADILLDREIILNWNLNVTEMRGLDSSGIGGGLL